MKAVIYARYSSHNQREQSIEDQINECKKYAAENNMVVIGEYSDYAISGTTDERPEFLRMIADSKKGYFQAVIVYKIDRFSRNRKDSTKYRYILSQNGVELYSAKEPKVEGPGQIIVDSMFEALAEFYSANLSQNIKRGMYSNARKCKANGVYLFGYKINENQEYEPDPVQGPIVQYIFNEFNNGKSIADILKVLRCKGVNGVQGKPISFNTVRNILKNEKYHGVYKFGDIRIEDGVPPLISKELFDSVQKRFNRRNRKKKPVRRWSYANYYLTGKLFCGKCGSAMTGHSGTGRSGNKYDYYACTKKLKKKCDKRNVPKLLIEDAVINETLRFIQQPKIVDQISDAVVKYQKEENRENPECKILEMKLKELNKSIDNIVKAIEKGMYSDAMKNRYLELEDQKKKVSKSLLEAKLEKKSFITKEAVVEWLTKYANFKSDDENFRKTLLDTFVSEVYLFDDDWILISYNFDDKISGLSLKEAKKARSKIEQDSGVLLYHHRLHQKKLMRTNFIIFNYSIVIIGKLEEGQD